MFKKNTHAHVGQGLKHLRSLQVKAGRVQVEMRVLSDVPLYSFTSSADAALILTRGSETPPTLGGGPDMQASDLGKLGAGFVQLKGFLRRDEFLSFLLIFSLLCPVWL